MIYCTVFGFHSSTQRRHVKLTMELLPCLTCWRPTQVLLPINPRYLVVLLVVVMVVLVALTAVTAIAVQVATTKRKVPKYEAWLLGSAVSAYLCPSSPQLLVWHKGFETTTCTCSTTRCLFRWQVFNEQVTQIHCVMMDVWGSVGMTRWNMNSSINSNYPGMNSSYQMVDVIETDGFMSLIQGKTDVYGSCRSYKAHMDPVKVTSFRMVNAEAP